MSVTKAMTDRGVRSRDARAVALCVRLGSQAQAAKRLGCHRSTVCRAIARASRRIPGLAGALAVLALALSVWAGPMIVGTPDAHGQPLPVVTQPASRPWSGQVTLPEGEYTVGGITTDRLVVPIRGRVVIRDSTVARIERFTAGAGDLELALIGCTITDQLALEMPASLTALALIECKFVRPDGPRPSYVYANAKGAIYVDGLVAKGGHTIDNGQHTLDLATNDGKLVSVRRLEDAGGSTSTINLHIKAPGLESLWISESVLRGKSAIDAADANNSKTRRTKRISLRSVVFDLKQHPTHPSTLYGLFPAHATDVVWGSGVVWKNMERGWPTDPEYGSQVPAIEGQLPWGPDGKFTSNPTPPTPPPATKPVDPVPPAAKPKRIIMELDDAGHPVRVTVE
jgi:hypothetical protein